MTTTIVISILLIICLWLLFCFVVLVIVYASDLKILLLEPMLNYPIIIFESDDWGTGPLKQEAALEQINTLLARFCDIKGHHPVMTLGIVLAEPNIDKITAAKGKTYYRTTLADAKYINILEVIHKGITQGVNSVQLHGMEHFWPESIMRNIDTQPHIKHWLFDTKEKKTEDLPSELQSRWVDSSSLPSTDHCQEDIESAIAEELLLYKSLFGDLPNVVVPPTFVWTDVVEKAYAQRGIRAFVTPGRQCIGRGINGKLIYNEKSFFNGQENTNGLLFLVRNDYFEPSLDHKAKITLQFIKQKVDCGRPALLEMHRFNFINEQEDSKKSLEELNKLLQLIQSEYTNVRYISTEHLAKILRDYKQGKDSEFMVSSSVQQFKITVSRIKMFFQFNRFAKYSGVNLLLKLC